MQAVIKQSQEIHQKMMLDRGLSIDFEVATGVFDLIIAAYSEAIFSAESNGGNNFEKLLSEQKFFLARRNALSYMSLDEINNETRRFSGVAREAMKGILPSADADYFKA